MKTLQEMIKNKFRTMVPSNEAEGGVGNIVVYIQDSNCSYNLFLKLNGGFVGILYFIFPVLCVLEISIFSPKKNN